MSVLGLGFKGFEVNVQALGFRFKGVGFMGVGLGLHALVSAHRGRPHLLGPPAAVLVLPQRHRPAVNGGVDRVHDGPRSLRGFRG